MNRSSLSMLALLLASMAALVVTYLGGHVVQSSLFNADALYLPTLMADLFARGGTLQQWYLTPAPYFFPDMPMFALAYLAAPDAYTQIIVFACLQIALLALALVVLARQVAPGGALLVAGSACIALMWAALNAGEPFPLLLVSAHHYGIFLTSVVLCSLWLRHADGQAGVLRSPALWAACALAFASALSDKLFLVQASVPLLASALLVALSGRRLAPGRQLHVLLPFVFSLLGSQAYGHAVTHSTRYRAETGLDKLLPNLESLADMALTLAASHVLIALLLLAYVAAVALACRDLLRAPAARRLPPRLLWITLFSLMSLCASVGALALVTNMLLTPRYLIPALAWPVVVVLLFARHYLGPRQAPVLLTLALFGALALGAGAVRHAQVNGLTAHHYPPQLACIDAALAQDGLNKGMAQYWDAKYLQAFSRQGLTLGQHNPDLSGMKWITNGRYLRPTYDFAIIAEQATGEFKISRENIARINGAPAREVRCGDRSVLIYGKDKLRLDKIVAPGDAYRYRACELGTLIGAPAPDCTMRKRDPAQEGYVTFGPYDPLPAGRYTLEVEYSSAAPVTADAGDWDVVLSLPAEGKILVSGQLPGSAGAVATARGAFQVDAAHHLGKVEFRTLSHAGMPLTVHSVRVALQP